MSGALQCVCVCVAVELGCIRLALECSDMGLQGVLVARLGRG